VIGRNCLGEFGIRLLLESEMTAVEAALAAEGWDGDAYEVSEAGERGPTALRWRTVWDTEDDAIEFEQAYNRLVQKRRVIARVKCEGIYVTVTQSTDNTFFDALKKAGVGK
jgi:hypothetical protein